MMKWIGKIAIFVLFAVTLPAFAFENLVYSWRGSTDHIEEVKTAFADIAAHANLIDIISTQAYHIEENGNITGAINPQMLQIAKQYQIKFMPLFTNGDFQRTATDRFLRDHKAQTAAIAQIVKLCQQNQFAGVQIDFEDMAVTDRAVFSHFYETLAKALHQNHLIVSVAIMPRVSDHPTDPISQRAYERFRGVYDYAALGKSSDFVTLMAYDQHGGDITPPGPMSGITWNEAIVKYALRFMPAEKISLGIPLHSGYWYADIDSDTGARFVVGEAVTHHKMMEIIKEHHVTLHWDSFDKVHYAFYPVHYIYQYIFAEDAASYKAKLALVKKYKLRGLSNWVLGEEDPQIWKILPSRRSKG